jgi:hypothetical protein
MTERPYTSHLLVALLIASWISPDLAEGQGLSPEPAWRFQTGQSIEWLRFLPPHLLLVSSDDALSALDPSDGSVRWQRDDLRNYSQDRFEAAQQPTPLAGATPGTQGKNEPIVRLSEDLPGGRLVAILADSAGRHSWFDVLDMQSGVTVWSSTSLR